LGEMKPETEGKTTHRTGPASWIPPADFGKLCRVVALIQVAADHGHNFKGKLGNPTKNGRLPR
jgi:hypothetical protein